MTPCCSRWVPFRYIALQRERAMEPSHTREDSISSNWSTNQHAFNTHSIRGFICTTHTSLRGTNTHAIVNELNLD